jgi:hypothetical protein
MGRASAHDETAVTLSGRSGVIIDIWRNSSHVEQWRLKRFALVKKHKWRLGGKWLCGME